MSDSLPVVKGLLEDRLRASLLTDDREGNGRGVSQSLRPQPLSGGILAHIAAEPPLPSTF